MAEIHWFKEKTGRWPVLLLDEVLAELDDSRREDLLERLTLTQQSFLTTTDNSLFTPEFRSAARIWKISSGRLIQS
jgi:DNA replication and repair protein RecF